MKENKDVLECLLETIFIKLEGINDSEIIFQDMLNQKHYTYKSVYPNNHFYVDDNSRCFRCLQNNNKFNYISLQKDIDNDALTIIFSDGNDSSKVSICFNKDNCDYSLVFGREKNGEDFFNLYIKYKSSVISIIYHSNSKDSNLFICEDINSTRQITTVTDNRYVYELKQGKLSNKLVDYEIDIKNIDSIINMLLANYKDIILKAINMVEDVSSKFYSICKDKYTLFRNVEEMLINPLINQEVKDVLLISKSKQLEKVRNS